MSAFAGPMVGGTFATFGNWRLAFVAVALQAALFIVVAFVASPKLAHQENSEQPKIPLLRLGLICLSVLSIAFAGAEVQLLRSSVFCALGVTLFLFALRLDSAQASNRLFPQKPLNVSHRVGAGLLLILTSSIASMSFMVYGPIMLETIHRVTPLAAGYIIAFESVCWGGAAVIVAGFKKPNERWLINTGTLFLTIALAGFALVMGNGSIWLIVALAGMQGAGFGIMWAYVVKRVSESANEDEADVTASAIPTMQQVGFAFGAAAAGIVANSFGFGEEVTVTAAQSAAFWIFIAFIPFALVACISGWRLAK
jgi:predicted MFS family arabinose efflux permease